MTFNPDAKIDPSKVSRRGRTGAAIGGGSAVVVIGLFLLSQFLGVDLTGLAGGGGQPQGEDTPLTECDTGREANESIDCRMAAAADSLDTYWSTTLPQQGVEYTSTQIILFSGQTNTGCGAASSAIGPFYCPGDQTIYLDTEFYDQLRSQFGSSGGPLAEMYVVAHEWGHHVQNISGIMNGLDLRDTGPNSDAVRLEVQADCFAGAWVGAAQETLDENGRPFLEPVTQQQINDALSAAAAVGDDRIQETTQGQVNPERWTHGSSEMRMRWFTAGLQGGPNACNTFEVSGL
jgi:predicted metalloprotease